MPGVTRRRIAIAALLSSLAVACTSGGATTPPSLSPSPAVNATQADLLPTTVDALPPFDVATFNTLLTQLRGTPVVVNIWGSWCAPCRAEAPDLRDAATRYGDRVQFLGIDTQDNRAGAVPFVRGAGWTYPSVFDPGGAIQTSLGLGGTPDTIFYSASGQVVTTVYGPISRDQLFQGVRQLLE
jgi:thiol-disulfide isomerase/thioredoxin